MDAMPQEAPLDLLMQAAARDLTLLAGVQDRELDAAALTALREIGFPASLALPPESEDGRRALSLLTEVMERLDSEPVEPAVLDDLAADYADIYLNHSIQASPMESVWLDEDGLAMQEPMFQVRAWYHRFGMAAENWRMRTDDHLVLQLQFLARLAERLPQQADQAEWLAGMARFLDEHLLRWIGRFGERVAQRCSTPFYAGVAMLTATWLEQFRDLLAELLDQPRPSPEEIEARMRPKAEPVEVPVKFMPGVAPSW